MAGPVPVVPCLEHAGRVGRGIAGRPSVPVAGETRAGAALADIEAADVPRFSTGIGEFDRVLGGGLVPAAWC
jgi:predicted ATP-dependent serine protease